MEEARKYIHDKLYEFGLTSRFLAIELERRYGLSVDKSYLSSALSGARKGPKADKMVNCSVAILKDFEKRYWSKSVKK